jgi:hypothetical protein
LGIGNTRLFTGFALVDAGPHEGWRWLVAGIDHDVRGGHQPAGIRWDYAEPYL